MLENKTLKVSLARAANSSMQQANLYVANLPKHYTKSELEQMFLPYGSLLEAKILLGMYLNLLTLVLLFIDSIHFVLIHFTPCFLYSLILCIDSIRSLLLMVY